MGFPQVQLDDHRLHMPRILLQQVYCLHPSSTAHILTVGIHKHQE